MVLRILLLAAILVLVFVVLLPQVVDIQAVNAALAGLTLGQLALLTAATLVAYVAAWPGLESWTHNSFLGLDALGWMSFVSLWLIQALIISQGMESVRKFQDFCGPAIWLVMIALAVWVLSKAGWTISLTSTRTRSPSVSSGGSGSARSA